MWVHENRRESRSPTGRRAKRCRLQRLGSAAARAQEAPKEQQDILGAPGRIKRTSGHKIAGEQRRRAIVSGTRPRQLRPRRASGAAQPRVHASRCYDTCPFNLRANNPPIRDAACTADAAPEAPGVSGIKESLPPPPQLHAAPVTSKRRVCTA